MKVANAVRAENARFGRLVTARSGAGDIRRAADLASGAFGSGGDRTHAAIEQLHATIRGQHAEVMTAARPSPFRSPLSI